MKLYFVSEFGDISVEKKEDTEDIVLKTTELTLSEQYLLKEVIKKYKKGFKIDDNKTYENTIFVLDTKKIDDVYNYMKKTLKKNKPTITAVKFKDGKIELSEELENKEIEKAVTVEKPRRGCPMPEFLKSEVRASIVLKEFLNEQQFHNFKTNLQFISQGNYTGKMYVITSRWSPKVQYFGQMYDLVDKEIICANCMEIPPSEEMLSLKLSIELNEKEFIGL